MTHDSEIGKMVEEIGVVRVVSVVGVVGLTEKSQIFLNLEFRHMPNG